MWDFLHYNGKRFNQQCEFSFCTLRNILTMAEVGSPKSCPDVCFSRQLRSRNASRFQNSKQSIDRRYLLIWRIRRTFPSARNFQPKQGTFPELVSRFLMSTRLLIGWRARSRDCWQIPFIHYFDFESKRFDVDIGPDRWLTRLVPKVNPNMTTFYGYWSVIESSVASSKTGEKDRD